VPPLPSSPTQCRLRSPVEVPTALEEEAPTINLELSLEAADTSRAKAATILELSLGAADTSLAEAATILELSLGVVDTSQADMILLATVPVRLFFIIFVSI
jgi:hypothetical protein